MRYSLWAMVKCIDIVGAESALLIQYTSCAQPAAICITQPVNALWVCVEQCRRVVSMLDAPMFQQVTVGEQWCALEG